MTSSINCSQFLLKSIKCIRCSTCSLVFGCWKLSHVIFLKLSKKELFAEWTQNSCVLLLTSCHKCYLICTFSRSSKSKLMSLLYFTYSNIWYVHCGSNLVDHKNYFFLSPLKRRQAEVKTIFSNFCSNIHFLPTY